MRRVAEAAYRRRRTVAITFLVALAVATAGALALPRTFMARTSVLVQPATSMGDPSPRPSSDATLVQTQVDTMEEFIKSRNFMVPTLKRLGYVTDGQTATQAEGAVRSVQGSIRVRPTGASTFEVTYTGKDPVWPVRVVDGVVGSFIDISTRSRSEQNDEAIAFLEGQLAHYRDRIASSRRAVQEYLERNAPLLSQLNEATSARLSRVQDGMIEARISAADARMRLELLRRQLATTPEKIITDVTQVTSSQVSAFESRLSTAEAEYSALLARYTDEHPEVKAKAREVDSLRRQLATAQQNPTKTGSATTRMNPAYERLKQELLTAESQLHTAQARESQFGGMMGDARQSATSVPMARQRFEQLQMEARSQEGLYATLVERIEQARLSNQMASRQQDALFRLIDPARIVPSADGTRRLAIILAGAAVGLILGLTLAGIQETTDRRVRSVENLERAAGVPVLAAIPLLPEMPYHLAVRRRRRVLVLKTAIAVALVGLLFMLGARTQVGQQFIRERTREAATTVEASPNTTTPEKAPAEPARGGNRR